MLAKKLLLAGLFLSVSAGFARAEDYRAVWRDSDGVIVRSMSGVCVRGDLVAGFDPCAARNWAPVIRMRHTEISQADRTVYFEFDRYLLSNEAKEKLSTLAEIVKEADDVDGVQIVGYADRLGSVSYNDKLSQRRAMTVRDYLIDQGIVNASVTKTRWVGKSEPTAKCSNRMRKNQLIECLQPDRKVMVELVYKKEVEGTDGQ